MSSKQRSRNRWTSSASRCLASVVQLARSANSTVTWRRYVRALSTAVSVCSASLADKSFQDLRALPRIIGLHTHGVHIDPCLGLGSQTLQAGFHRPGEEQAIGQRIRHGGAPSGAATCIPRLANLVDRLFIAQADELFAVELAHVGDVKRQVSLALRSSFLHVIRYRHTAGGTYDYTLWIAPCLTDELPKGRYFLFEALQRDHHRHPAIGDLGGLRHTFG